MSGRLLACLLAVGCAAGCVSSKVQTGAAIGALSGAAAGGTVGLLITDEDLLGSPAKPETGDTSLPRGGGILASVAIGTVLGAVIGAMVGHQQDDGYEQPKPQTAALEAAEAAEERLQNDAPEGDSDMELEDTDDDGADDEEAFVGPPRAF